MNELISALRAVHVGCAMLLFGEILFALVIRMQPHDAHAAFPQPDRHFFVVARWSLGVAIVSGAAWFVVQSAAMSGLPLAEATSVSLGLVLRNTVFGSAFGARSVIAIALAVVLAVQQRRKDGTRSRASGVLLAGLAAGFLGSLAWTGHAVGGDPAEDALRVGADVAHLLAAGAWLGALPALVSELGCSNSPRLAAAIAGRFSTLGVASVGVLTATGLVNAWYQIGGIPALVGTDYGRLLIVKLALFVAMLGLATVNRGLAARATSHGGDGCLRRLRNLAIWEVALGIGLVAVVGVLGTSVPGRHEAVVWPFDHTLGLAAIRQSAWLQVVVAAAGAIACIAAGVLVAGALAWPPRLPIGAAAGAVGSIALLCGTLAVPSFPTTYAVSPVGYAAEAVLAGAVSYAEHCSRCHGDDGAGKDWEGGARPGAMADLRDIVPDRREGDLFWVIGHGLPGSRMPGSGTLLQNAEIWELVQFLDAQVAARNALALSGRLGPVRPVPAPDFAYEVPGQPQQSLRARRENPVTLLVFYTVPDSLRRLREIASHEAAYALAGARIIALPMTGSAAATARDVNGVTMLARAHPAVASTYRMFAGQPPLGTAGSNAGSEVGSEAGSEAGTAEASPPHVEYLIDRSGLLRARVIGVSPAAPADAVARQVGSLASEPNQAASLWTHRH